MRPRDDLTTAVMTVDDYAQWVKRAQAAETDNHRFRAAIEDALTTLGGYSGQTIDAVRDILESALIDGPDAS